MDNARILYLWKHPKLVTTEEIWELLADAGSKETITKLVVDNDAKEVELEKWRDLALRDLRSLRMADQIVAQYLLWFKDKTEEAQMSLEMAILAFELERLR